MVFDKTGTITEGRYVITDVFPVNMTERELLTTAASAGGLLAASDSVCTA